MSEQRQHILLLAELYAIVYLTVEVNGKIAYLQQGALDMQQHGLRLHNVLRAHNDTSGKGERTVEPSRHNRSAIHLGIKLYESALDKHLGIGLDAERGRVGMCANHVEASIGKRFGANAEGKYRRVVLGNKEAVARVNRANRQGWVEAAESACLKHISDVLNSQKINWRSIEEG